MGKISKGLTLVELLTALILLSIIVLGLTNIDFFSLFHVISSDRRAKLQNEASLALEHMSKQIVRAIGNEVIYGDYSVVNTANISGNNAIEVYVDSDASGNAGDGIRDTVNDRWIAYGFTGATGDPATQYQLWYCPQCPDANCATCTPAWGDVNSPDNLVAKNISGFTPSKPSNPLRDNYVTIQLQACWDPSEATYRCNTADNPSVDMKADIHMPAVSTN